MSGPLALPPTLRRSHRATSFLKSSDKFPCCRNSNTAFREALREIEKRPACGGLPMISFLILPMQRVTRLPLLTDVRTQEAWVQPWEPPWRFCLQGCLSDLFLHTHTSVIG